MTIKRHDEVAAASRHAIHNLEYADRANREAGTGEGSSIVLAASNLYQTALQISDKSFWNLSDDSPIIWRQLLTPISSGDTTLTIQEGGILKKQIAPIELADTEYYDFPAGRYGAGTIFAVRKTSTTAPEIAEVHWDPNAVVTSIYLSTNAAITDVASHICVFDNGNYVRVKNNLGYTIYLVFDICIDYGGMVE